MAGYKAKSSGTVQEAAQRLADTGAHPAQKHLPSKHTPGPWGTVDDDGEFHVVQWVEGRAWTESVVATVRDGAAADANAALVAVAPEMLEALKQVERLLLYGENPRENGEGYAAHLDAVRSIIAKAEAR